MVGAGRCEGKALPQPEASDPEGVRRVFELMRRVNSSSDTSGVLEEIVTGVVEVLGFGVAAIARLEGSTLVMTHVAGPDDARQAILGRRTPAHHVLDEFHQADRWGILRYVPHDLPRPEGLEVWVPTAAEETEGSDAWHPHDALYAPLYSATGELLGNMAVDLPPEGRVPSPELRELLELFVVQAGLALSNAQQRERLTGRVRRGEAVAEIARMGSQAGLDEVLETAVRCVHRALEATQVWVRCYTEELDEVEHVAGYPVPNDIDSRVEGLEGKLDMSWRTSEPFEFTVEEGSRAADCRAQLAEVVRAVGAERGVYAPIGVGTQLLGSLGLAFAGDRGPLTTEERETLVEITRELGRVVHTSRLHQRERRLVSELRELDRYKGELIATISHELKTPLTSIIGHVELMQDAGASERSLAAVERNARRLDRLVQNLLDYSRVQERRANLRTCVDLTELCVNSVELVTFQAETAGVEVELHTGAGVQVSGDPDELARVVDNIVGNAVKYTSPGGRVSVTLGAEEGEATLTVADTGLGISPLDQQHLFSAFHRSSNPQALSIPGTGLGLAISRRITEQHGGSIEVDSTLGEGSTFTVRLPLRAPSGGTARHAPV